MSVGDRIVKTGNIAPMMVLFWVRKDRDDDAQGGKDDQATMGKATARMRSRQLRYK